MSALRVIILNMDSLRRGLYEDVDVQLQADFKRGLRLAIGGG